MPYITVDVDMSDFCTDDILEWIELHANSNDIYRIKEALDLTPDDLDIEFNE